MKTLLLDKQYQPIRFIKLRKLINFVIKDKVEIISVWNDCYLMVDQPYPSIVRLFDYVNKRPRIPRFNRKNLFRRDDYTCCYTGRKYPLSKLTVDHVIPRSRGGKDSWENCVTACIDVNYYKGAKTPEEAGLDMFYKPKQPELAVYLEYMAINDRHFDWSMYFKEV